MITTYNRPPYFDDFNIKDNDKTVFEKNYHRILFQPSNAVQNRELNQLQSILQSQISQFGLGVYQDGTPIIGGITTFQDNVPYIDIEITNTDVANAIENIEFIETRDGSAVVLRAEILGLKVIDDEIDLYRLWLRYTKGGNGSNRFEASDEIRLKNNVIPFPELGDQVITDNTIIGIVSATGDGFSISVNSGVFFIKGCFVHTPDQSKFFIKPTRSKTITGEAIFNVVESITTSETDETLLDNANGSPNFSAPGADRYTITLNLAYLTDDADILSINSDSIHDVTTTNIDYNNLLKIKQSLVFTKARTKFSELNDVLAQRTFEESGSYTVNPFLINIRELFNDEQGNGGRYTLDQINENNPFGIVTEVNNTPGTNLEEYVKDRMLLEIDPSVAYIEGYRVELADKLPILVEKTREFDTSLNINVPMTRGNYIDVVVDNELTSAAALTNILSLSTNDKIRNIEFRGEISNTEPEGQHIIDGYGETRAGFLRYRLYVYNNFNINTDLPAGFEFRYVPGTISGGEPIDDTSVKNTNLKSAIFELQGRGIKDVISVNYTVDKLISSTVSGSTPPSATFGGSPGDVFTGISSGEIALYNATTGKYLNPFVEIASTPPGTNSLVITFKSTGNISSGDNIAISVPVRVTDTGTRRRSKTFTTVTNQSHTVENGVVVLNAQDVIINSIQAGENFIIIDDGQNESFYDSPVLKFASLSDGDTVDISYNYFEHSTGDYFTVNSYPTTSLFGFSDITEFGDKRLSDFIDFRVKRQKIWTGTFYDYSIISGQTIARVEPNSIGVATYDQFLPRTDIVTVDTIGSFYVVKGQPDLNPITPDTPNGTIKLYELGIPPFVYNTDEVLYSYIDNKRYRMRDIGSLEKRISNLEYYSSLSLLEKEAAEKKILDLSEAGGGVERFKNGILVDSFLGHNVGDVENQDYLCSIDRYKQILRPYYKQDNFRLKYTGKVNGSIPANPLPGEIGAESLSLDIGQRAVLFENLIATQSMSVQPFEVAVWEGQVTLSPSSDEWIDTNRRPSTTINLNGFSDAIEALANRVGLENGVLGTEWNAWQTNWQSTSSSTRSRTTPPHTELAPDGIMRQSIRSSTTSRTTTGQVRTGVQTNLNFNPMEIDLGDRVVDLSIIPFIRSRDVYFRGNSFKPNTKLYAFFDEEDVTKYVRDVDENEGFQVFGVSNDVETFDGQPAPGGDFNQDLVTDDLGDVIGVFRIPNNDELRFRTGIRKLRLTDNPINNALESDTFGESLYSASGLVQEKEQSIISTRIPEISTSNVSQNRTVTSTTSSSSVRWVDPVAQTFYIDSDHPEGAFLSSIDLFFADKPSDESIGAEIYLVSVENGIPTTNVIPGSKVFKHHSEIISTGRNIAPGQNIVNFATNFEFKMPLYVKPGTEYAVIVFAISPEYRIWTSELGGRDLVTGQPVIENPSFGVLLKSANKRTWTPDQNRDIMIRFNQIKFPVNQTKTFEFTTKINGNIQNIDDFIFSLFNVSLEVLNFPNTAIEYFLSFKNGSGQTLSEFNFIKNKENYELDNQIPINFPTAKVDHVLVQARLISFNEDLSPIIDLERCSLIGIQNYVNDINPEDEGAIYDRNTKLWTEPVYFGGPANSRYITRKVTLANPSEDLRVIMAVNRPSENCDIQVYAKRRPTSENESSFENEIGWYQMQVYAVDNNINNTTISTNAVKTNYVEVEYILPDPDPNFNDEAIGEDGFSEFTIKIVFTSNNIAQVVTIKDLRAIASI
jgi:hypothetical protein